ncbi:hypothetical protein D3C76_149290 [compost metagenome]
MLMSPYQSCRFSRNNAIFDDIKIITKKLVIFKAAALDTLLLFATLLTPLTDRDTLWKN